MFCLLWVLFQAWAVVVDGGVSSGSAEANGGVNNNGGAAAAGNTANPGAQNGVLLNGDPLVVRLLQLGGTFFIQPVGNQAGQAPLQQLIPTGALQQGGAFPVGQTGGVNVNPQGQVLTQAGRGGPLTLFTLLSQRNAGGNPQGGVLTPGQVQLISLAGLNNQQRQVPAGGNTAGGVRFQRSLAARLRGTQSPPMKVKAAEEEEEDEEEECSGMEEKQVK
ncbi:unnamed protein product [Pleuronectes platessa]|uniref:Uncharacterized protein n=1 Tax=Pleuronectes platessa TaxID=8262 RepID=A0A9N7UIY1_PLEPL|nr:unnamed protein product [Pleuronectes platessa]